MERSKQDVTSIGFGRGFIRAEQWRAGMAHRADALPRGPDESELLLGQVATKVIQLDHDLVIQWANQTAADSVGLRPEELIGQTCHALWGDPARPCWDCPSKAALQTHRREYRRRREPDGSIWEEQAEPIFNHVGDVIGVVNIAQEVTEAVRTKEALRSSDEMMQALLNACTDLIVLVDGKTGEVLAINEPAASGFGRMPDALQGVRIIDLLPSEAAERCKHHARQVVQTRAAARFENVYDGKTFDVSIYPVFGSDGRVSRLAVYARDITLRRQAEEAYRAVVDHSLQALVIVQDWRIVFANKKAAEIAGLDLSQVLGMSLEDVLSMAHPDDVAKLLERHKKRLAGEPVPERSEYRGYRRDGTEFWIDLYAQKIEYQGRPAIQATAVDITERKRAEEALHREHQQLFRLLDTLPACVCLIDRDHCIRYGNRMFRERFGDSGSAACYALIRQRSEPCENCRIADGIEGHEPRQFEWTSTDGRVYHIFDHAFTNVDGTTLALRIGFDITERTQSEEHERQLQAQIQAAQRFESLGKMAGGIAHEFNNLLVGILGNTSLIMQDLPEGSPLREGLQLIEGSANRAAELTNQMLAFSGRGRFMVEMLDLSDVVRGVMDLFEKIITQDVTVRDELAEGLPPIEGDLMQIRQMVLNLLTNAAEASEGCAASPPVVTVRTGVTEVARGSFRQVPVDGELPEGRYVYLDVIDTGCGMDEATQSKIFEPFFTTKFTGRGLGLAATLGIVRGHGGAVRIRSKPGRGATFNVLLPVAAVRH